MIDIKYLYILKILKNEIPNGNFALIESKDIIASLPNKYKLDIESISKALSYLERNEFINIKYADDGLYCLCILPKTDQILEKQIETKRKNSKIYWIIILITFFSSFIGSLLATYLINIIL